MALRKILCANCGKKFSSYKKNRKYCSRKCYIESQRKLPNRICVQCGKKFRPKSHRQHHCGKSCSAKTIAAARPNTKGWSKTQKGYIKIYKPDHPNSTVNGYVMEHRLVMEDVLGRYLSREEVVHHINGIKDDNRPENLRVMTKRKHDSSRRPVYVATCPHCGEMFPAKGNMSTVDKRNKPKILSEL